LTVRMADDGRAHQIDIESSGTPSAREGRVGQSPSVNAGRD
jgi:hypothetical protein